ncbi:hypothetical protein [Streptomyces sp. NBC_01618]|uniref:hypothetical protein n=1 Tax=Streptomyces sp. NBC_01618 TaxID=2975900 RepID=UPI00386573FD|nr:hypothetical protein OH735_33350 [Streptomyces sp. NBC_01618]
MPKKSAHTVWNQLGTESRTRTEGIGQVWLDGRLRATLDGSDWKQAAAARGPDGRWKVTVPALGPPRSI